MNDIKILNTKLSENYSLPYLKNFLNKGEMEFSIENMLKRKELDKNKNFNKTKITKFTQLINKLSDNIIYTNKSLLNLLNKNEYNLIFMNEQQYIRLIKPFNFKLASMSNHIYTFTNKSYKQINKNLHNLYIICKSAFLNMSSIISKPIISINSNLIKITLFYY